MQTALGKAPVAHRLQRWRCMHRTRPSLLLVLGVVACGGDPRLADDDPTLANVQRLLFTPTCATRGCHAAGALLDLSSEAASFATLVEQPATNPLAHQLAWRRVKAGDPERSFLVRKLDGPGLGEGDPMPSAVETISGPSRQLLVQWISDGATP
jgi:hypothetical protein